ncbi:uncharacterized protein [Chelonus insularis]|uniref:uncharacterized protein n=1 Tax=Chelonus insularis TaxID=460826 RepID=UPI00158E1A50|nr:uncharacterized protein LOC118063971 [Chelonus insularis]
MHSWVVAIGIKNSTEWSYGSLISDNAVLTSAAVVANVHESDLTVMRECKILSLPIVPMELCDKRKVSNIKKFQNDIVILILNLSFNLKKMINIAKDLHDIDKKNCLFMQWDFINMRDSTVQNAIINSYKVFFLEDEFNIAKLIHNRLRNQDIEYAISNVTAILLQEQDGHNATIDMSREFLGNPLICTLKSNQSTYVQIGVAAGYLMLPRSNDFKLILGRYYVDVVEERLKITAFIERNR